VKIHGGKSKAAPESSLSDLLASRVKGSARQLFKFGEDDEEASWAHDFFIRPTATRSALGLAVAIGDLHAFGASACNNNDCSIPRVPHGTCTPYEFQKLYMGGASTACILEPDYDSAWPAGDKHWGPASLLVLLGPDARIEVKDAAATVSFGDYCDYLESDAHDDSPAYLWESLVDSDAAHAVIIDRYKVNKLFGCMQGLHTPGDKADLLSCAGEDGRLFGNHRWLLIGGPRSGSSLHVDPLATSAWNLLLLGRKLWCVFPPLGEAEAEDLRRVSATEEGDGEISAALWFFSILPRLVLAASATWPPALQPLCFLQHEGETVYIPSGHHHAVLNLTDTVCVTQNWAETANYAAVLQEIYAEAAFSEDDKDAWRIKVAETVHADGEGLMLCVHCGQDTDGRVFELFFDRPLCQKCQHSRQELYGLCSAAQAEAGGVILWKLRGCDTPPHIMGGPKGETQLFSVQHIEAIRNQQGEVGVWDWANKQPKGEGDAPRSRREYHAGGRSGGRGRRKR